MKMENLGKIRQYPYVKLHNNIIIMNLTLSDGCGDVMV